tara:strand:- start:78 stop:704 length:627 start_codon:yes stop_codon:yes gene_type:complete
MEDKINMREKPIKKAVKKINNSYKVFVLQTDEDGKKAQDTVNSIKKYEKDFNVMVVREPYGLQGTKGIAAIPLLIGFNGEAIVVTDEVLCISNLAELFFNKPTVSFSAGLNHNVCLVQPWGGDSLDIHWHFSESYMDLYRRNSLNVFSHIVNNYDFSGMFKYKNPPPKPSKPKQERVLPPEVRKSSTSAPKVVAEEQTKAEKKKKGWW